MEASNDNEKWGNYPDLEPVKWTRGDDAPLFDEILDNSMWMMLHELVYELSAN